MTGMFKEGSGLKILGHDNIGRAGSIPARGTKPLFYISGRPYYYCDYPDLPYLGLSSNFEIMGRYFLYTRILKWSQKESDTARGDTL